jgi:hypothetical protein
MAGPAGLLGAVRQLALGGERVSVESFQNDLFMQRYLGRNSGRIEEGESA